MREIAGHVAQRSVVALWSRFEAWYLSRDLRRRRIVWSGNAKAITSDGYFNSSLLASNIDEQCPLQRTRTGLASFETLSTFWRLLVTLDQTSTNHQQGLVQCKKESDGDVRKVGYLP